MADQLAIYNVALAHLGERRLASLTEPREPTRVLNDEWDAAVRGCLEIAPWSFAAKTAPFVGQQLGSPNQYSYAFSKPVDWLRTIDIAQDASLTIELENYTDEAGTWFAGIGQIFVRYVSTDGSYGYNIARWPQAFADFVALALAARACRRLTGSGEMLGDLVKLRDGAMREALTLEEQTAARVFPVTNVAGETKLAVFNDALAYLGRSRIWSLTQASDTVRELNDQYRSALRWCLQRAPWNFAMAVTALAPSAPAISYSNFAHAFQKPDDWLSTANVAQDVGLQIPVGRYVEEGSFWLADPATIVVRYVSLTTGADPSRWPPSFCDLLALRLAELSVGRVGADAKDLRDSLIAKRTAAEASAVAIESQTARVFPVTTAATTQLQAYNDALAYLGQPRVVGLSDASETVRTLNEEWPMAVRWALEQGPWTFAIRAIMIGPFGEQVPTFGYSNAFLKPDDWLQTVEVSEFDDFRAGSTQYADETGWWFANVPGLFVRYVSTGPNYGMNLPRWSPSFVDLVSTRLAERVGPRLGASAAQIAGLSMIRADAMKRLRATDALNTPPAFPPEGGWVQARRGRWVTGRRFGDGPGGPRTPLTGDSTLGGDSDLPVNSDIVPRISG